MIVCSDSPAGMLAWFALIHARRASPAVGSEGRSEPARNIAVSSLTEYNGVQGGTGFAKLLIFWSGRPGSNRRRPAWEAGILPLNYSRVGSVVANEGWRDNPAAVTIAAPTTKR